MAVLTIRRLDETVKARLRARAAERGHSMEEEVRRILEQAVRDSDEPDNLADLAAELFGPKHGVDLDAALEGQRLGLGRPVGFEP